ncbi:MAG: tetratricopeptide repeat protein, partial [Catalinimonas sp.]
MLAILLLSALLLPPVSLPDPHRADSLYQTGAYPEAAVAYEALVDAWNEYGLADSARYYQLRSAVAWGQDFQFERSEAAVRGALRSETVAPLWVQGRAYNQLGYLALLRGEFEAALDHYQASITAETSRRRVDTLLLAKSYEFYGLTHMQLGDLDKALRWVEGAHRLRTLVLDPWDKELGYSANSLYQVYDQADDLPRADSVMATAWRILKRALPPDHPHLAILANNYSVIKSDQGDVGAARELLEEAMALNRAQGRHVPMIADYNNLGSLYLQLHDPVGARLYLLQGLAMADTLLPYPHLDRAYLLDGLGATYYMEDNDPLADSVFRRALREKVDLFGEDHPQAAQSWFNLGLIAYSQKRLADAHEYYRRASRIYLEYWGADHPRYANVRNELGELAWDEGDSEAARTYWREALATYHTRLGFAHVWVLEAALRLAKSYEGTDADSLDHYLRTAWGSAVGQSGPLPAFAFDSLAVTQLSPQALELINYHLKHLLTRAQAGTLTGAEQALGKDLIHLGREWIGTFLPVAKQEAGGEATAAEVRQLYAHGALFAHWALRSSGGTSFQDLLLDCVQAGRA